MKLEKTLFKISISETIILSLFLFVVLNGVIFLFSVVIGKPSYSITDSGWISQIVFPFVYSIIQTSINRNGVLKLTEFGDLATLTKQIESLLLKKGYIVINSNTNDIKYIKRTKWSRFFNHFFRENINIKATENEVSIFSKRNLLSSIEWNLIYGKTNG